MCASVYLLGHHTFTHLPTQPCSYPLPPSSSPPKIFSDDDGPSKTAALVGGIVGGVLGGLALVAAGIAFCVVRHKRRAAAEEAAYQAKYGAPAGALPITASSGAAAY